MAAVYTVERLTGAAPGTPATITNCRLRTDDANTQDLTNPVPIDASLKRSYGASIQLEFSGTFTQIDNIRIFSPGANTWTLGTSGDLFISTTPAGLDKATEYVQATGTPGDTGDELVTYHTNVSAKTAFDTYVTGSPLTVDANAYSSADVSDHSVFQVDVDTDATAGLQSTITATYRVDEI